MNEPKDFGISVSDGALALWLALELRRARAAFDKSRIEQDAKYEVIGTLKTGVRVNLTLKSASEICVSVADAVMAKAAEFQSAPAENSGRERQGSSLHKGSYK